MLLHAGAGCAPPPVFLHEQSDWGSFSLGHGTKFSLAHSAVQEALTPEGVDISSLLTLNSTTSTTPTPHAELYDYYVRRQAHAVIDLMQPRLARRREQAADGSSSTLFVQ